MIPNVGGSSQEVVVNGVPGVFIGQNGSEEQTSCLNLAKSRVWSRRHGQLDLRQALQLIAAWTRTGQLVIPVGLMPC